MIKHLPESDSPDDFFVVTDIENRDDGSVFWIQTAWREDGEIIHLVHKSWAEYWDWLEPKSKQDKRFRRIYAHNGGGWDWLSFIDWLLTCDFSERDNLTLNSTCAGSKMVILSVRVKKSHTVKFCDSLQLLRSSLDKLSQAFLGRGKIQIDNRLPIQVYYEDRKLFEEYVKYDCENLLLILESTLEMLRKNVAKVKTLGHTIGSTALQVFKTCCVDPDRPITIPWDRELKDFLRLGYTGGRVEVFKCDYFDSVNVYDINSLYPSVMLDTPVPVSDRGYWVKDHQYPRGSIGAFEIEFIQRDTNIPPVLLHGHSGVYSGRGIYYSPDIECLLLHDPHAVVFVNRGYVFFDTAIIFKDYVERLYEIRIKNPDNPISLLAKFLLNSLYGKFGQKPERESIVSVTDFDDLYSMITDGAKVRTIDDDTGVYSVINEVSCEFEHLGIAGMITSAARARLYDGLFDAGLERLCYCDTDSIHMLGNLDPIHVSNHIGKYKLEFHGEGVYAGKKLYALRDGETEKIRCKGVSVGGRNGSHIKFDDIVSLLEDKEIECKFKTTPTVKQVFSGKKSCVFFERKRKLKRTATCQT